ncbi:peptide chain release factor N(5)-glutamine methyltransferase [Candidatus Saccharibacteria bacterium]|nr:peptide chain release factor N(5)-glutamine methyltransferase [Candidatus Saccharibacteria bacterium]
MQNSQWLDHAIQRLTSAGIESARLDAIILLEDTTGKDRTWLLAHPEHLLTKHESTLLAKLLERRGTREPLAYMRSRAEFYGRTFFVVPDVLIPRPESEAMIDQIKSLAQAQHIDTIIDVGTGSGCLAISAKLALPDAHVIGIDISEGALEVARKNARTLGARAQWERLDIMQDNFPHVPTAQSSVLLANLPYVPDGLVTSPEINKEPKIALFSGRDGLDHYRALFGQVSKLPTKPLAIITEALEDQHSSLARIASVHGFVLQATHNLAQTFVLTTP